MLKATVFTLVLALSFSGCVHRPSDHKQEAPVVMLQQNPALYTQNIEAKKLATLDRFKQEYFLPWHLKKIDISRSDANWIFKSFSKKNCFGLNLRPLEKDFFQKMQERSNMQKFATLNTKALSLHTLSLRALPTDEPLFMNPERAGEGFPFDYLQNSLIAANKPLLVSHYSKEKEWVFVRSSFAFGWLKSSEIALIDENMAKKYEKEANAFCIEEKKPVYDKKRETFLFRLRLGMLLPLQKQYLREAEITVPLRCAEKTLFVNATAPKDALHKGVLEFNRKNVNAVLKQLLKNRYGWGGMYSERDCSSTLRDFFAPFGVWLPRNSRKQSQIGKVISLEGLSDTQKLQKIKKEALPFETLLYKRGHILLYAGIYKGEVVVFHNVWGIKTVDENANEGRYIIGKALFSTLTLGSELPNFKKGSSLLHTLTSMNIVTQ